VSEGERRRVLIRLKHSLAEDEEINTMLPDTLEEIEELARRLGIEIEADLPGPKRDDAREQR
jgi:hypothetical protein